MKYQLASPLRSLSRMALVVYVLASIPVVAVFVGSEYVRFVCIETVTHWYSKFAPIKYVFIGDNITAAGRNWGMRLTGNPLAARNLGVSGYTIRQTHNLVRSALGYRPQYVVVTAGTNDILQLSSKTHRSDPEYFALLVREYSQLVDDIICGGASPVATLIPYTADSAPNRLISALNSQIAELARLRAAQVVDLNDRIAPEGVLLPEYSSDGVHLSGRAYDIWAKKLLHLTTGQSSTSPTRNRAQCPKSDKLDDSAPDQAARNSG